MKNYLPLLALGAGIGQVSATWKDATPFNCPGNTDNKCTEKQKGGFNFGDLNPGPFDNHNGFNFGGGWKCESSASKRDVLGRRTFGKHIGAVCGSDRATAPKIGCGSGGDVDKFSVDHFGVTTEFDCDLEFWYDMPNGDKCKHRSPCSKFGSSIKNTQCGGAKNVTIVYPPQPNKPKPSCSIGISTISFDCSPPKTTAPPPTYSVTYGVPGTTTSEAQPLTSSSVGGGSSVVVSPPGPSSAVVSTSYGASTTVVAPTSSVPAVETPATSPPAQETPATSSPAQETSPLDSSSSESPASSSAPPQQGTGSETTYTTSFLSTSTIFTTSVQTITSCGPEVPDCPANTGGVVTTIVTVPLTTTLCPVTETRTSTVPPQETGASEQPPQSTGEGEQPPQSTGESEQPPQSTGAVEQPTTLYTQKPTSGGEKPTEGSPQETSSASPENSSVVSSAVGTTTKPSAPVETLPCPTLVPKCLKTFSYMIACVDNTDTKCFCPNKEFIQTVYDCFYSNGETDDIIAKAVDFLKGLCAPSIPENPVIATGADSITSVLTVTETAIATSVQYTTYTIQTTEVVPATDSAGVEVPNSSSTVTVSTVVSAPQVGFTPTGSDVAVVPSYATSSADAGATQPAGGEGEGSGEGSAPATTPAPVGEGTGAPVPPASTTGAVVTAAGDRFVANVGLVGLAVLGAVAAL